MLDELSGQSAATEERLSTAASHAIAEGKTSEALAHYEKLYTHSPSGFMLNRDNVDIAVNYAQLLRKTGKAARAITVLAPFTKTLGGRKKMRIEPIVANEYAASLIELGNFEKAEKILSNVLERGEAQNFHADARNLLGIALGSRGEHKKAEESFRLALEGWKGDATSVMNNLAVCLANQGMFDESLTLLRQALVTAPNKPEIAHNIQMVSELRQAVLPKPSMKKVATKKPPQKDAVAEAK